MSSYVNACRVNNKALFISCYKILYSWLGKMFQEQRTEGSAEEPAPEEVMRDLETSEHQTQPGARPPPGAADVAPPHPLGRGESPSPWPSGDQRSPSSSGLPPGRGRLTELESDPMLTSLPSRTASYDQQSGHENCATANCPRPLHVNQVLNHKKGGYN